MSKISTSDSTSLSELMEAKRKHEAERAQLRLMMEEVERKITHVQSQYGAIYNKTASLLKLPTEVTCMIFDAASGYPMEEASETEDDDDDDDDDDMEDVDRSADEGIGVEQQHETEQVEEKKKSIHLLPEIVISHVCRRWREVALSYTSLWTSFCYDGPRCPRVPLDRFEAYLHRSQTHDLELWFDFRGPISLEAHVADKHIKLLQMAISHGKRWKRVTILSDQSTPVLRVLSQLRLLSVPKLEHFAFCAEGISDKPRPTGFRGPVTPTLETTVFLDDAPKLSSFYADSKSHIKCLPPLSNITTLRIESLQTHTQDYHDWPIFRSILELPSLANFSLVGNMFRRPDPDHLEIIKMEGLVNLRYSDNDYLSFLLPYIRAPLLETLIIHNDWLPQEFAALPNLDPQLYVFPSLHTLRLHDVTASSPHGAWYLIQMTQNVKELFFSHRDVEESVIFVSPRWNLTDPACWQKLQELSVNVDLNEFNTTRTFLTTRKSGIRARLSKDMINFFQDEFPDEYELFCTNNTIEKLSKEDLSVGYWPPMDFTPDYFVDETDPFDIEDLHC